MNRKKYNFCIVTYEAFPNPITQNLKTFLLENYRADLLYIFHPMPEVKQGVLLTSGFNLFRDNQLTKKGTIHQWKVFWLILYIKDVYYTFFWCLKFKKKFDVYFAAGNLNPIVGIFLKQIGFVKKIVYISMDYYPTRYKNKFLDWFYFQLDKFCVRICDETWNVSSMIAKAREKKMGMDRKTYNRQYTVPGGIWFYKTKRLPFGKVNRKKIVYRGTLLSFMGVDLVIKAMPLILKKIPKLIFEIVGTGEEQQNLKNLTIHLKVSKNVIFHGFVEGRKNMEKILATGAVGMATFNTDLLDERVKNSDPGKIKDYMLLGMPVITTNAFPASKQIVVNGCGLIIPYRVEELAKAVITLLKNPKLLYEYRKNAIKYIEKFDCNNILKPNLERVLN